MASCFGGGGGAVFARFRSGFGGVLTGLVSGLASVAVVGCEAPFLSCSCGVEMVGLCVPAVGLPVVVRLGLPVSAGVVSLALGVVVPVVAVVPGDGGAPLAPGTGSALALGSCVVLGVTFVGVTPGAPGLAVALIDALAGGCNLPS